MVGYTLKSDRVYVYAVSAGGHFERRYAWLSRDAREIRDDIDVFDAIRSSFNDSFAREESISSEDAESAYGTHPTLGQFFTVRRVKSFLYVPIISRGTLVGCMMLETVEKKAAWDSHAVSFVSLLSKVFAAYLERVAVESELVRGKEFDVFISDKLEMCVFWWQKGSETIDVNRHWAKMMGHTESSGALSLRDLEMLVHEEDIVACRRDLLSFEAGKVNGIDRTVRVMTQGGEYRWLWVRAEALERDEHGLPFRAVGVTVDISDRMTVMSELEERRQQSQNLESLRVLAGGVAHDFNNILAVVSGNTELILRKSGDEMVHGHAYKIIDAVKKARSLASQMLTYSGRNSVVTEVIDLNRTVRGILSLLEVNIANKADLRLNIADDYYWISANSTQIRQVAMNLVSNAAEAMLGKTDGVITIESELRSCTDDFLGEIVFKETVVAGMYACLRVQDNGCGMSKDVQKKIFEPFFTTKFAGRGLGLAAVWGIVRSAKGFARVESIPNQGTIFEVYFPLAPEHEIQKKVDELAAISKRRSLLLCESSGRKDYILRDMLDELEWNVYAAENETDAATFLKKQTVSIGKVMLTADDDATVVQMFNRLKRITFEQNFVLLLNKKDFASLALEEEDLPRVRFAVRPFGASELRRVLDV
jgi:signal transduction histidine kinase